MKSFVAAVLLMIAASTIFYIMVVSPKVAGSPEDEVIKVTTINNENIRLTMSVEKDWVHLGENLVINFEAGNESAENVWLAGTRAFYFDVYDKNHVKIGTWPRPIGCKSYWDQGYVSPGGFYSESLVWDLAVYRENYDCWDNVVYVSMCSCCWPEYERVELEPGTYYLEGHTFYTHPCISYCMGWNVPELVTPLLKITILPSESI